MSAEEHERNRHSWNAATRAHNAHKRDQAAFLRAGGDTLFPEELALLGDVGGLSVLHLLCNSGQDSLCLARRGAEVTGVDISDEAVEFATRLSLEAALPARFERSDVYPWLEHAAADRRAFDVVFLSYGALLWLSELDAFARGAAAVLAPGGRVVIVDFHPVSMMFDGEGIRTYGYFERTPVVTSGVHDYVAESCGALCPSGVSPVVEAFENPHPDTTYQFGLGQLVTALLGAGLTLTVLREYPFSNGARVLPELRLSEGRRWVFPEGQPDMPLMFGLAARKPGAVR